MGGWKNPFSTLPIWLPSIPNAWSADRSSYFTAWPEFWVRMLCFVSRNLQRTSLWPSRPIPRQVHRPAGESDSRRLSRGNYRKERLQQLRSMEREWELNAGIGICFLSASWWRYVSTSDIQCRKSSPWTPPKPAILNYLMKTVGVSFAEVFKLNNFGRSRRNAVNF